MSNEVEMKLDELGTLEDEVSRCGEAMLYAYGGKISPFDALITAALDRALSLISGYILLVKAKNFRCAAHLVRLHLDNYIRLNAARFVDNFHEFALSVLNGEQINNMKDSKGNKMTDAYLVKCLSEQHPTLKIDYDRTCGYVHFGRRHFLSSARAVEGDDTLFEAVMSKEDMFIPDNVILIETTLMINVTHSICRFVDSYTEMKNNQVAKKQEGNQL